MRTTPPQKSSPRKSVVHDLQQPVAVRGVDQKTIREMNKTQQDESPSISPEPSRIQAAANIRISADTEQAEKVSIMSFKQSQQSKKSRITAGGRTNEKINDVLARLQNLETSQQSMHAEVESIREQYESSWNVVSKNKVGLEKIINDYELQNGYVGVKQFINDWTIKKKDVMAEVTKLLNERSLSLQSQMLGF